jgi:uncharacterized membrane protein
MPAESGQKDEGLGKTRMEAMSDGLFAVAMTLLLADAITEKGLASWMESPRDLGLFAITFSIVGLYWIAHNNECRYILKTDRLVLWTNLLFLAPIACMPVFLASLMKEHGPGFGEKLGKAQTFYLLDAMCIGVAITLFFLSFAFRRGFVTKEGQGRRGETIYRNLFLPLAYLGLLLTKWWNPEARVVADFEYAVVTAPAVYVLLTLLCYLLTRVTRRLSGRRPRRIARGGVVVIASLSVLGVGLARHWSIFLVTWWTLLAVIFVALFDMDAQPAAGTSAAAASASV